MRPISESLLTDITATDRSAPAISIGPDPVYYSPSLATGIVRLMVSSVFALYGVHDFFCSARCIILSAQSTINELKLSFYSCTSVSIRFKFTSRVYLSKLPFLP